jgi:protein-S-isoprenylcysteine O-methyltransferase Ste14
LAPVINTLISTVWHPQTNQPFHFAFEMPGWKLWVGILLVGVGAALVLLSKEEAEAAKAAAERKAKAAAVAAGPTPPAPEVK